MKLLFTFLIVLPFLSLAQTNVVNTSPNSFTPGDYNVIIGYLSGNSKAVGESNVMIGVGTGIQYTTGRDNVFIGNSAGNYSTTGNFNTFLGSQAGLYNRSGEYNTFLGYGAGTTNNGNFNTFIGLQAGYSTDSGNKNVFMGSTSGFKNTAGFGNTFIGSETGTNNTIGTLNTAIGYQSGLSNVLGVSNTFLGTYSGDGSISGAENTFVGYHTKSGSGDLSNATALGANAIVNTSNSIVLGDTTRIIKVGIGTASPRYPLDVKGVINLRNNGTIKFSHLSNPFLRNGYTDQFLSVNENGETVMARYRLRTEKPSDWADRVFEPGYRLQSLSDVERHIRDNKRLPDMPSAQQVTEEGVDLVKMNALLLQKVEELTLYSIQQQKENQSLKSDVALLKALMKQVLEKK
ncbi:hypothetical protein GCM10027592_29020 [Spirosoma flavus]